ncbi:DUF1679 domain-containing protein [Alteromonas sp. IB21]|uniref:oxidoreductase family protein n=1 Tax=Alteromonas sp. IB21 TaxID=2779369 RepID=UPI0018E7F202|nr:oxidoreductase family protein [Alteromonas sp. IB21]MBJ2129011.1 DUF1679 domain-containing protein [Alteromonas sp. IB21]
MENSIDNDYTTWLGEACRACVVHTHMIQPLWSGYGACFRAKLEYATPVGYKKEHRLEQDSTGSDVAAGTKNSEFYPIAHSKRFTHVVVKCASPPSNLAHPKGWNGQRSDERKRHSFRVENYFYDKVQWLTTERCRTATCVAHAQKGDSTLLVMEDLAHCGYTHTSMSLSPNNAKTVLKWLAHFHGRFLTKEAGEKNRDTNLWPEGTYWHLSTREDEYQAMPEGLLKQNAEAISKRLSSARYQTLVHGDAKVANFCFTADFSSCAAVDFQYVGYGVGVKDVAYFLGSALTTQEQQEHRETLLDTYFNELEIALLARLSENDLHCAFTHSDSSINNDALMYNDVVQVIKEWKYLYSFACADFYRFLAGWSPEHWKLDQELQHQTDIALAKLSKDI